MNRIYHLVFFIGCFVLGGCSVDPKQSNSSESASIAQERNSLPLIPQFMMFCGQRINLEDEDIRERLDREILVNAYYQSATIQAIKRAHRFFPKLERILKAEGIPDDFKYLAVIESGLVQAVSPVGAQGFWQFMPYTAEEFGLEMTDEVDERLHIEKSTRAACQYLRKAKDTLKDWLLTTAAYNRGVGGVRQDLRWQGTTHYFDTEMNSETGRYVFRLLAVKMIMENPEKYGLYIKKSALYKPFRTYTVTIKSTISDLAKWAIQQGINYKILVKLNPWILTNRLTVRDHYYAIQLPHHSAKLKPYQADH